jgi:uncharacterized damage-inducible protein DinB
MSEITRILEELQRAYDGAPWYGPSLTSVLTGLMPDKAAARPAKDGHSIWELAAHVASWERIAARRLSGEVVKDVPEDVNFPPIQAKDAAAWQKTLADLAAAHSDLVGVIRMLQDSQLDANMPGEKHSLYFLLQGVIQHNVYHAGQMALLKKL